MKGKYTLPLELSPEIGDRGLYFTGEPYDIEAMNMEKRVRVFINQLLPDIAEEATSKNEIEFAYKEVLRLGHKFVERLEREDMHDEIIEVHASMHKVVDKLSEKLLELLNRDQRKIN